MNRGQWMRSEISIIHIEERGLFSEMICVNI